MSSNSGNSIYTTWNAHISGCLHRGMDGLGFLRPNNKSGSINELLSKYYTFIWP